MEMFETIIGNEQISVIFLYGARYQQWSMNEKYYISLKYMVTEIRNTKGFSKSWNDSKEIISFRIKFFFLEKTKK